MPNKCAVVGCRAGLVMRMVQGHLCSIFQKAFLYRKNGSKFLNRADYSLTPQSCICIEHFEDKYIVHHSNRQRLNYSLAPIPTIHQSSIPKSQKVIQKKPRKHPVKRVYQEDELPRFKGYNVETLQDIALFFTTRDEHKGLKIDIHDFHVTAYRVELESGIMLVKECIYVDQPTSSSLT